MWSGTQREGEDSMSQKSLDRLLSLWQKRLRIQDWDISASIRPHETVDGYGLTNYNNKLMTATIRLCSPETASATLGGQPYLLEQTLIHELLHLEFAGEPATTQVEQGIDRIAWALYRAYSPS